jgi:hypothetical protein
MIVEDREVAFLTLAAPQLIVGDELCGMGRQWGAGRRLCTEGVVDERQQLGLERHPVDGSRGQVPELKAGRTAVDAKNVASRSSWIRTRDGEDRGAEK